MSGQNLDARSSSPKSLHGDILGSVLLDERNAEIGGLAGLDSKQNKIPGVSHGDEFHWCQDWTSGRHERGFDDGQQQQVPKEDQWWQLPSLEEPSG